MNPILEVSNLSVTLGHQEILSDIQFSVNEHDVVVILGPNGAGKSTLMRSLVGLVPHSGTVTWHTKNIAYLPPQESIARSNLPPLTVKDFFRLKNISADKALNMLEKVGLDRSLFMQQFATLSTGQFQRMMLAWMLINTPKVLLLDEPTAGIDMSGQESIYTLLHSIWKEHNLTILLITHDINIIWKHATNVLCINKKLMCSGCPEETVTPEQLKQLYGTEVSLYEHRHS